MLLLFGLKKQIILETISHIDTEFFLFLNGINSPTWDIIFGWITSKTSWIPLYVLLLTMIAFKYKWKTILIGIFIGLLFVLADQISVQLFKNVFERLRPCHNPEIASIVHTLGRCGGQFGFVSSHASNSFALAIFTGLLLRNHYRFIFPLIVFWAVLVSYSRIYVGVHYPADVLGGAILGTIVAIFVYYLMKFINKRFNLKIELI